jgi:mono/diheme cytochrome c family protein
MYYPVAYEPYKQIKREEDEGKRIIEEGEASDEESANSYNPYGMSMRLPVRGTIARRNYRTTFGEGDSAVTDLMVYNIHRDSIAIAERTLKNPLPASEEVLAEGKVLYSRYCQHCHGENGKGDGLVGQAYKGIPSYSAGNYKTMNSGHIFHVITHGKGRMWPHGSQVDPADRWKIVHYVHQLQQVE